MRALLVMLRGGLDLDIAEIRIFSREEKKQDDMHRPYANSEQKIYIGDVRDYQCILNASRGRLYFSRVSVKKNIL